ncbi:LVIVD repeat-containing protein [Candidatus Lokiarchaeum ossiferum]|uniref:LVIVD repeat-containing protein n=1 Tax=Candidatus Lokiarchaeum ossiferum TaxID=2951803 RepID=UPI00352CE27B
MGILGLGYLSLVPLVQGTALVGVNGSIKLEGKPIYMEKLNDTILVVAERWDGLEIFDISDPNRPQKLSDYRAPELEEITVKATKPNYAAHFSVHYPYVYLAGGIIGLEILDLSDPSNPIRCSRYYNKGIHRYNLFRDNIVVFNNLNQELNFINVSDPYNPINLGRIQNTKFPLWDLFFNYIFHEEYIYSTLGRYDLNVFNFSLDELTTPAPEVDFDYYASRVAEMNSASPFVWREYLSIQKDLLYRAYMGSPLQIYDISNPANPRSIRNITLENEDISAMMASQSRIYMVNQREGEDGSYISYLNTSAPVDQFNFTTIDHLQFDTSIGSVKVDQDLAFVGIPNRLRILSLDGFSESVIYAGNWGMIMVVSSFAIVAIFINKRLDSHQFK